MTDSLQMQEAAQQVRGDDTGRLKTRVLDILAIAHRDQPIALPVDIYDKSQRGFNHEFIGSLLCPAGMDWKGPK